MANRIVGNVYIIDSGSINLTWPLTTAGSSGQVMIDSIGFYGVDTTARMTLTYASNTLDAIISFAGATGQPQFQEKLFSKPINFEQLRVVTLVAGTGWIYIS